MQIFPDIRINILSYLSFWHLFLTNKDVFGIFGVDVEGEIGEYEKLLIEGKPVLNYGGQLNTSKIHLYLGEYKCHTKWKKSNLLCSACITDIIDYNMHINMFFKQNNQHIKIYGPHKNNTDVAEIHYIKTTLQQQYYPIFKCLI